MFTAQITVPNETGLHARPASALVRLCKQYQSSIHIRHGELDIDAKSIVRPVSYTHLPPSSSPTPWWSGPFPWASR